MSDSVLTISVQTGEGGAVYEASIDLGEANTPRFAGQMVEALLAKVGKHVRAITAAAAPHPAAGAATLSPEGRGEEGAAAPSTSFAGSPPPLRRGGPQ